MTLKDTCYTISEVASLLKNDRHTIYKYINEGKLKAFRVNCNRGGRYKVTLASIQEFRNKFKVGVKSAEELNTERNKRKTNVSKRLITIQD